MAYARARKHYRVAEKEIDPHSASGIFIADEGKCKLIALMVVMALVIFAKGILIGALAFHDR